MTDTEVKTEAVKVLDMISVVRRRLDIVEMYTRNAIKEAKEGNPTLGYYLLYAPLFALETSIQQFPKM